MGCRGRVWKPWEFPKDIQNVDAGYWGEIGWPVATQERYKRSSSLHVLLFPLLAVTAEVGPWGVILAWAWLSAGSVVYVGDWPVSPHLGSLFSSYMVQTLWWPRIRLSHKQCLFITQGCEKGLILSRCQKEWNSGTSREMRGMEVSARKEWQFIFWGKPGGDDHWRKNSCICGSVSVWF